MINTADLWDSHFNNLHCADAIFRPYGRKIAFSGKITTLKLFEDNSFVRQQLETNGKGKVLVIDGGGSLRCALLGDNLAALAIQNNWAGIIINGCIRDSHIINTMDIGVRALNTSPVKSIKSNIGQTDIKVKFSGVTYIPNQFIYVDSDGILLSTNSLIS